MSDEQIGKLEEVLREIIKEYKNDPEIGKLEEVLREIVKEYKNDPEEDKCDRIYRVTLQALYFIDTRRALEGTGRDSVREQVRE